MHSNAGITRRGWSMEPSFAALVPYPFNSRQRLVAIATMFISPRRNARWAHALATRNPARIHAMTILISHACVGLVLIVSYAANPGLGALSKRLTALRSWPSHRRRTPKP